MNLTHNWLLSFAHIIHLIVIIGKTTFWGSFCRIYMKLTKYCSTTSSDTQPQKTITIMANCDDDGDDDDDLDCFCIDLFFNCCSCVAWFNRHFMKCQVKSDCMPFLHWRHQCLIDVKYVGNISIPINPLQSWICHVVRKYNIFVI